MSGEIQEKTRRWEKLRENKLQEQGKNMWSRRATMGERRLSAFMAIISIQT